MKNLMVFVVSIIVMFTSTNVFGQTVPDNAGAITGPTSVCMNSAVVYAVPAINNATSYMWTLPAGASISSGFGTNIITVQFGTTGGTIMVFGQNGTQFGNGSSLAITMNAAPTISVTANPNSICAGGNTTLSVVGGTSWIWSTGTTTPSTVASPVVTTAYTVTVTGTNGCTTTGNVPVTVHTGALNVSLNLTQDNICSNEDEIVLSGGYPAGGHYSCPNTGVVYDSTTIYPPICGVGTWNIVYTVTDANGCTGSATDLFTVNPRPNPTFDNIGGSVTTATPNVDLYNYVEPQGATWNGTFSGPGTTPGSSIFSFALAGEGTHMLTYTVVNPLTGCEGSQIQFVTIARSNSDSTGNNPNGIEDIKGSIEKINIFPNPSTDGQLHLSEMAPNIETICIMNLMGTVVYTTEVNSDSKDIDVSTLGAGNYFIKFTTVDGLSGTRRFTKQ